MTAASPVTIATSLVPDRDIALQSAAVATWQALGWSVCTLNAPEEAAHIQQQFPGITVVGAVRSGQKTAGKPLPLVTDLLRTAGQQNANAPVIGFVNSDIFLRQEPALTDALVTRCTTGAVLLPRVDVKHIDDVATYKPTGSEKYSIGYDGVFMARGALAVIPESIFCIGMPFWDYWLPLVLMLKGQPLYSLQSPIALHVTHETRWNQSIYIFFHALLSDALAIASQQRNTAPHGSLAVMVDLLQHSYTDIFQRATHADSSVADQDALNAFYDRIQEVVVHHIKAAAIPLQLPTALVGHR